MTFDINLGNDVYLTYGTPVLKHMVADAAALNTDLKRIVLAREQAHPEFRLTGRNKSAQGGWQSAADLLSWPAPEIATLQGESETAEAPTLPGRTEVATERAFPRSGNALRIMYGRASQREDRDQGVTMRSGIP